MKTFVVFTAILALFLFVGCGDDGVIGQYSGFPDMQGGEWVEYTMPATGKWKYEFLGTDTIDDQQCFVIEFEMEVAGQKSISQIWIDQQDNRPVLYVMKQGVLVIKMDALEIADESLDVAEGVDTTPPEYTAGNETSTETYETPTGKQIEAAVFKIGESETWVSEEVPFGIVKMINAEQTIMELYDFSFSGAKSDISKEEIENASDIPGVP